MSYACAAPGAGSVNQADERYRGQRPPGERGLRALLRPLCVIATIEGVAKAPRGGGSRAGYRRAPVGGFGRVRDAVYSCYNLNQFDINVDTSRPKDGYLKHGF
jgi:hypothetical protein